MGKIKNLLLFVFIFFIFTFFALSLTIDYNTAQRIALNWTIVLQKNYSENVLLKNGEPIYYKGVLVGYVFHLSPKGYILVSGEDYLPPIKLYSTHNNFGEEGKRLEKTIIENLANLIRRVEESGVDPKAVFLPKNFKFFEYLKGKDIEKKIYLSTYSGQVKDVSPLMKTQWGQGYPYNIYTPTVNGDKTPTGCVATAFAQIMKYFEYPEYGRGSHSYVTDTHHISLSANFNHKYYWDKMLNTYDGNESDDEKDAVARLMYDVGVAFNMDYDPDGSGAYPSDALDALPNYFKYSSNIKGKSRYYVKNDDIWFNIAKDQVDLTLPVAFSIYGSDGGHEVVIDGYRISGGAITFHINFGWDGYYDGYYSLNNVSPGGMRFEDNEYQYYVYYIYPPGYLAVLPPQNVKAVANLNQSIFFSQYVVEVTWEKSPSEDDNIVSKYRIYLKDSNGKEYKKGEVKAGELKYTFRLPVADRNYSVAVTAIDKKGKESIKRFVTLEIQ